MFSDVFGHDSCSCSGARCRNSTQQLISGEVLRIGFSGFWPQPWDISGKCSKPWQLIPAPNLRIFMQHIDDWFPLGIHWSASNITFDCGSRNKRSLKRTTYSSVIQHNYKEIWKTTQFQMNKLLPISVYMAIASDCPYLYLYRCVQ